MSIHSRLRPAVLLRHAIRNQRRMKHSTAYVTTPIYYVNAVPHIGHLYSSVIADTLKRYYALKGADAYLCTGTDEHGLKIQQAAAKNNASPLDFCDRVSESFRQLCDAADISYTTFIRTTEPRHAKAVAALWTELEKNGYIYKGKHEGWYAVSDEAFYASNQVKEAIDEKTSEKVMVAIESGQRVEWTEEENYKFKLSAFQEPLLKWINDNPTAIVPGNRRNEVTSWIKAGLSDLSVSRLRSRLDWGIPVPSDPGHTIYVWLDALANYLTANGYPWPNKENSVSDSQVANVWPADVHVVGKDIVRFHAIYWPAFLMAAQLPLPKQILAHAHWTMGKQKMSKSRGNVADPFEVMDTYGVDPVRYYLVRDGGFADDGDYSEDNIIKRYKDLAGQLGNLLNRSTAPALNPNAIAPAMPQNVGARDQTLHAKLAALPDTYDQSFEAREFGKGLAAVFDMLAEANKHFQDNKPWDLAKDPAQKERLDQVLYYAIESCRVAGILLQPVLPSKMDTLLTRLGVPKGKRSLSDAQPSREKQVERPLGESRETVLFPRLKK
ncbi:tRNA synthetases class I (M)-domain-containing protein [Zychaea mexicana]|uniref:tRNA synthetases class I (M)-domain-containing protein n=1 Tax=Zychaea mexicana TaxID=64656 RepID=UPI0022FE7C11|nr:tRNA synthetases class I (M)-domain-containing protein [Zychaea mexicana]KAI9490352.1 tRNA synthetases class I (M)-domain-containing protein [Zychaea mexicana]